MTTKTKNRRSTHGGQSSEHGRSGNGGDAGHGHSEARSQRSQRRHRGESGHHRARSSNKQATETAGGGGNGSVAHRGVNALSDSVKSHPIPAMAVGAGLGYLAARGLRRTQATRGVVEVVDSIGQGLSGAASTTRDALGTAGESVKNGAERAWHGAERGLSKVGSRVRDGASAVGHGAERALQSSRDAAISTWEKHPLMVCTAVLVAGAAAGMLLPRTAAEEQTLGK